MNPQTVIAIIQGAEGLITLAFSDVEAFLTWARANTDAAETAQLQKLDALYAAAIAEEQGKASGS